LSDLTKIWWSIEDQQECIEKGIKKPGNELVEDGWKAQRVFQHTPRLSSHHKMSSTPKHVKNEHHKGAIDAIKMQRLLLKWIKQNDQWGTCGTHIVGETNWYEALK
jgi:hypothetical protein